MKSSPPSRPDCPLRLDSDRVRLRLAAAFIEHAGDIWPLGEPDGTPESIRAHVDDILEALEQALRRDGRDVHRFPHRLHWVLWLLNDLDAGAPPDS